MPLEVFRYDPAANRSQHLGAMPGGEVYSMLESSGKLYLCYYGGAIMNLYLIQCGQTEWSAAGRMQGRLSLPLSEAGVAEATALADQLAAQLAGQPLDAFAGGNRGRGAARHVPLAGFLQPALDHFGGGDDGLERIVEFMRHACGQDPDGRHFL